MPENKQEDYLFEEFEKDRAKEEELSLASEPLFSALLRDVIVKQWPDDKVMDDFVEYVAGPMSDHLGHVGAKGGEFVVERRTQGLEVAERYVYDQTMRGHLINGLFPRAEFSKECFRLGVLPNFAFTITGYDEFSSPVMSYTTILNCHMWKRNWKKPVSAIKMLLDQHN